MLGSDALVISNQSSDPVAKIRLRDGRGYGVLDAFLAQAGAQKRRGIRGHGLGCGPIDRAQHLAHERDGLIVRGGHDEVFRRVGADHLDGGRAIVLEDLAHALGHLGRVVLEGLLEDALDLDSQGRPGRRGTLRQDRWREPQQECDRQDRSPVRGA